MAPALAYGRHRGPARRGSRIAAVAVAVYQDHDGQWNTPLTLRPAAVRREQVARLREVGFGDAEVLAICEVAAYYAYVNRIADGLRRFLGHA